MKKSFDRRAAAGYALRYAINYNPSWPAYRSVDCTNFVSQALLAGGWNMIEAYELLASRDPRLWYSSQNDASEHSWSWSNATAFFYFLRKMIGERVRVCTPGELALGDIVQLRDYDIVHHTVIVTGVLPTTIRGRNKVFVTYHTNDTQQTVLESISNNDGSNLLCWKVLDMFEPAPEPVWAPIY